ncbi:MAG: hypothetical protein PQJ46_00870 [Spirochaetales bacterium]|nr:hypothetical protein [Spirochaetales bacterium]
MNTNATYLNPAHLHADYKQIVREPIMVLFMFIPLFIFIIFKLIVHLLQIFPVPFEIDDYHDYIFLFAILITPQMLGTVTGFLMIDERDARILELMSVTPLGYSGYVINRLLIPLLFGIIYTIAGYYILNLYEVGLGILLFAGLLIGIEGIMASLILFTLAEDKVKGLTISKAMGVFPLIALADLLKINWLSFLAHFFPYYWVKELLFVPCLKTFLLAAIVHLLWMTGLYKLSRR